MERFDTPSTRRAIRVRQYAVSEGHKRVIQVPQQSEENDLDAAYSQVRIKQVMWSGTGSNCRASAKAGRQRGLGRARSPRRSKARRR